MNKRRRFQLISFICSLLLSQASSGTALSQEVATEDSREVENALSSVLSGLSLGGYVVTRYEQSELDGGDGHFSARELGLILSAEYKERWEFYSEFKLVDAEDVQVDFARLSYRVKPTHSFGLGLFQVPFGLKNGRHRAYQNHLVSLPRINEEILPTVWRDVGLTAEGFLEVGAISEIRYSAYLGNGLEEGEQLNVHSPSNTNSSSLAYGGKLAWSPLIGFELGGSVYHGGFSADGERGLTLWGAHLQGEWKYLEVEAEYVQATMDTPADVRNEDIFGFYGQVSFYTRPWLILSYRLDRLRYQDAVHGAGFESGIFGEGIDLNETTHSLGLLLKPLQNVGFKAEYRIWDQALPQVDEDRQFLVEGVLRF